MAHTKTHTKKHSSLNRKQTSFIIGSIAIGIVFLVSIIGIFTGKFRPFADCCNTNGGGDGNSHPLRTNVALPPAAITYTDPGGHTQTLSADGLQVTSAPYPAAVFSLAGVPDLTKVTPFTTTGKVTIKTADGTSLTGANPLSWSTTTNADAAHRQANLLSGSSTDNVAALEKLDNLDVNPNLTYVLKPDYYLAAKITGVNDYDKATFNSEFAAGDFNNDNTINVGDLAVFAKYYNQPVNDTSRFADLNHDGTIDAGELAVFAKHFNESGPSL